MINVREKTEEALSAGLTELDLVRMLEFIVQDYRAGHANMICKTCHENVRPYELTLEGACPYCGHDEFYTDVRL